MASFCFVAFCSLFFCFLSSTSFFCQTKVVGPSYSRLSMRQDWLLLYRRLGADYCTSLGTYSPVHLEVPATALIIPRRGTLSRISHHASQSTVASVPAHLSHLSILHVLHRVCPYVCTVCVYCNLCDLSLPSVTSWHLPSVNLLPHSSTVFDLHHRYSISRAFSDES